ncbi:MAG: M43 family zinc metalloprotease [Planctomycetota bacterium]|jgi:Tol biopolymer transport system component
MRRTPLKTLASVTTLTILLHAGGAAAASHACGSTPSAVEVDHALRMEAAGAYVAEAADGAQVFFVPVALHVVRRSDGTGGLSLNDLDQSMTDANESFAAAGLVLCPYGDVNFIDDDALYFDVDTMAEINALRQTNAVPGAINVYFTEILALPGLPLCGISSFTGSNVQGIAMRNSCTAQGNNPSTLAHEFGHYFDLFHTHETSFGVECIDGSNCAVAGDLLCDTPADPQLGSSNVNAACDYTGPAGPGCPFDTGTYDPDTTNFMSYSRSLCRTSFSPGQVSKMRATLLNLRPELAHDACPTSSFPPTPGLARVSVSTGGAEADGYSEDVQISADGRYVLFTSQATNLVDGVTVFPGQLYLHDRETGETTIVSVNSEGEVANSLIESPSMSSDARYIAFSSWSTNLAPEDTLGFTDTFRHDRLTGETRLVSVSMDGGGGDTYAWMNTDISDDGRFVAFSSRATNLLPDSDGITNQVFLADMDTGELTRVSVSSDGELGNHHSDRPALSADGRFVAFTSGASNFDPRDPDGLTDAYVHDRLTGETEVVSIGPNEEHDLFQVFAVSITDDGRYVAFELVGSGPFPNDQTTVEGDILVKDRVTRAIVLVSANASGAQAAGDSKAPRISPDGRYVAFQSTATNLHPDAIDGSFDIFVHDLQTSTIHLMSPGGGGAQSTGEALTPALSANGRTAAYTSDGFNLVPDDTNGLRDAFVYERALACPADLDDDGDADFGDLLEVIAAWGPCAGCPADLDGDGVVGFAEVLTVIAFWDNCG